MQKSPSSIHPSGHHNYTCDHYYPREGVRELSMWRQGSVVHSQRSIDCDRDTEKLQENLKNEKETETEDRNMKALPLAIPLQYHNLVDGQQRTMRST